MNDLLKTSIFVGVAAVMTGFAVFASWSPDQTRRDKAMQELAQGEPFFKDFNDPRAATSLEVIEYDEGTASQRPFKVEVDRNGKWTIPSHYDYPADGKDRLAKTASGVIDLKKDVVRSLTADQHEEMGVIDPLDAKSTALKGRGKRVTLKDKTGKVLADFIIGKPIKDKTGQRYVRVPEQKAVYGVKVDVDLSTKFADWIETNLLKIDSAKIRKITFDSTKVDPEAGRILPGEKFVIERKDASSPWQIADIPPDQEVATEKVSDLTSGLADLKIAGVRPKPAGLTRDLSFGQEISFTPQTVQSLVSKGFYPTKDGRMLSNQGEVQVETDEGMVYTLRFGEATFATGQALSAGKEDEEPVKEKGEKDEEKKSADTGSAGNRYLMVTVKFDDSLIPRPESMTEPGEGDLPRDVFERSEQEQKDIQAKAERDKADYEKKLADNKKKAEELSERFAGWYYLTPDSNFKKIALERSAATRKKGEKPAGGEPANPSAADRPAGCPASRAA
ncbi:MAG: DUF4340 domain-containing protein [Isosphaeraceae bacterium]